MTHSCNITGITCTGYQSKVQGLLSKFERVLSVFINPQKTTAAIERAKHISINIFQEALQGYPKYQVTGVENKPAIAQFAEEGTRTWWATCKPVLLIGGYITTITFIASCQPDTFHWMDIMRIFMAGFCP